MQSVSMAVSLLLMSSHRAVGSAGARSREIRAPARRTASAPAEALRGGVGRVFASGVDSAGAARAVSTRGKEQRHRLSEAEGIVLGTRFSAFPPMSPDGRCGGRADRWRMSCAGARRRARRVGLVAGAPHAIMARLDLGGGDSCCYPRPHRIVAGYGSA